MYKFFRNAQKAMDLLDRRLRYLDENIENPYRHIQWFERLDETYSAMRFNSIKILGNLRIIFCIIEDKAFLLSAFQEKKKSDYRLALEVCKGRIEDIRR